MLGLSELAFTSLRIDRGIVTILDKTECATRIDSVGFHRHSWRSRIVGDKGEELAPAGG